MKLKPYIIGRKLIAIWVVPITVEKNEQDCVFAFVDKGKGKKAVTQ